MCKKTKNKIKFNKKVIEDLVCPKGKLKSFFYDTVERGLGLWVTKTGIKTYFLYRKYKGIPKRFILGRSPETTVEQARKRARLYNMKIDSGLNPLSEKNNELGCPTLGKLFEEYIFKVKGRKKSWKADSEQFNRYLSALSKKKLIDITKKDISDLFTSIGERSPYSANRLLSLISVLFNSSEELVNITIDNPTKGIKKFPEKSRERYLNEKELHSFFDALNREENDTIRDFFKVLLLTGVRKSDLLSMKWSDINFENAEWFLLDPTKSDSETTVHLSAPALKILRSRYENTGQIDYVFVGRSGKTHLKHPRRGWDRLLQRSNLKNLRIHDLRRTFGSFGAMVGGSLPIIGKSLNHKSTSATQIYARLDKNPIKNHVDKLIAKMVEGIDNI